MNIPPGFEGNIGNKVCKLKKALYGLKQSPRAWFGRFAKVMKEFGYKESQGDHTLFIKHSTAVRLTAILVYVDDIIVTGNDEREKHEVKQRQAKEFEIKEQGELKYFLGIEVTYSTQGIFISQQKYVIDYWQKHGRLGVNQSLPQWIKTTSWEKLKKNQWWIKECTRGWLVGSYILLTLSQTLLTP